MRIGELAERAGTTTRTLRHYESRGLLPARRAVTLDPRQVGEEGASGVGQAGRAVPTQQRRRRGDVRRYMHGCVHGQKNTPGRIDGTGLFLRILNVSEFACFTAWR